MKLSILIPTYMRTQVLWDTLEKIRTQLGDGDEVLVIDQNDPPLRPPEALRGPWLRLCRLPTPSLTRARNLGIGLAAHETLVFLDDDVIPDPNLLPRIRQVTLENPGCILTGVVDQEDKPEDVPTPGFVDLRSGEIRTNFSRPISGPVAFFPGCLSVIPKSALPPAPWFCPAFKGASQGEEIDFAFRAAAHGKKILSDPGIRIYHLRVVEGGCRSPEFRRAFFLDHVFNQSLFHGRHGKLPHFAAFLKRVKGFLEFHTRLPGKRGHSRTLLLQALLRLGSGLFTGIRYRIFSA